MTQTPQGAPAGPTSTAEELLAEHYSRERQLAVRRARADRLSFCELALTDEVGRPIRLSGCHVEMVDFLERNRLALVCVPRGHAKSTLVAGGCALYEVGNKPRTRIRVATAEDTLATMRVRAFRGYIEQAEGGQGFVHEVFPHLRRNARMKSGWTDHELYTDRDVVDPNPTFMGRGILSTITGGRTDVLIGDDVCDFRNSVASPANRAMVKTSWFEAWMNTMVPAGRVWYVYTPWHRDDLSAHLERMAAEAGSPWKVLRMPVVVRGDRMVPVWPEVWGEAQLRDRRAEVGPASFARGFELTPLDDADCPLLRYVESMRVPHGPEHLDGPGASWPRVLVVDPAISRRRGASETVILVVAIDHAGRKWIDPVRSVRTRMSSPETARAVVEAWKVSGAAAVLVESNAYQKALIEWIVAAFPSAAGIPIQPWTTGSGKLDPELGVPGLATEMAASGWALPFGPSPHPDACACILCAAMRQCGEWPVGERDDVVMTMWMASAACRRLGVHEPGPPDLPEDPGLAGETDDDLHGDGGWRAW